MKSMRFASYIANIAKWTMKIPCCFRDEEPNCSIKALGGDDAQHIDQQCSDGKIGGNVADDETDDVRKLGYSSIIFISPTFSTTR